MTHFPDSQDTAPVKPSLWALSPLLVFFLLYLVISVAVQDFYAVPVTVAFTAAAVWAVLITRGKSMAERVDLFSSGVANRNILMMIWIFVLAGAFAQSARDMGAIDATVQLTLRLLPDNLLLASVFIASCFISLSVGTSVGTIVALAPVATGLAHATQVSTGMMTAIVVGGAFFGDNLSFISDTTIAATRTQGCAMRDKFRANVKVVLPAALLALACYTLLGWNVQSPSMADAPIEWMKVFPYLLVLVTALAGVHVMAVLTLGLLATGLVGVGMGYFSFMAWFRAMGSGMTGMGELIIVTLLAGGVLALIRFNGGIAYIIGKSRPTSGAGAARNSASPAWSPWPISAPPTTRSPSLRWVPSRRRSAINSISRPGAAPVFWTHFPAWSRASFPTGPRCSWPPESPRFPPC